MNKSASCRCCLSRPPDKSEGIRSLYGVMLKECFNIQLRVGVVSGDADICDVCIKRLQDAYTFKAQVLKCQLEFEAVVNMALEEVTVDLTDEDAAPDLQFYGTEENLDCGASTLRTSVETNLCSNKELTVRRLRPVPAKMKPVPSTMKPVPAKTKPVPSKMKPVPAKNPVLAKMKPVLAKRNPVSAKMKTVQARAGSKHERPRRTEMSEGERLYIDAGLLYKYSNVTPFQHKSIAGVDCLFCCETLPTMAALREHTHNKHENNKVPGVHKKDLYLKMDILDLQCKLCHTDFDLISTLKKHLTDKHNILFRSQNNYILEFKLTDAETMNCARCDSTFETFKTLQQHMSTHYKNYVCAVCAAGFINARLMRGHLRTHETGTYKCSQCDKLFNSKVKLTHHEKTHRKKREMRKCPHCGVIFNSYYARNKHMVQVHEAAAAIYKCKVCDREFYLKRDLSAHIRRDHLMERNHVCPVCGNTFFSIGNMKAHMITHGDKSDSVYKCAVCHKTYARKSTLREHMRIHNNDRRFQCGECGVKFVQKCSLKGHMMSSHGLTLAECDSEGGVYTCKSS